MVSSEITCTFEWRAIRLNNLRFPLGILISLFADEKVSSLCPKVGLEGNLTQVIITADAIEGFSIKGKLETPVKSQDINDHVVHITQIDLTGEWSGTWYMKFIEPLLRSTKGEIAYTTIWEGELIETKLWIDGQEYEDDDMQWEKSEFRIYGNPGQLKHRYPSQRMRVFIERDLFVHVVEMVPPNERNLGEYWIVPAVDGEEMLEEELPQWLELRYPEGHDRKDFAISQAMKTVEILRR